MPDLSIIIITWNAEQYVKNCLDSVLENTSHISREIIVIDNGSTDATRKLLQLYESEGCIFFLPQNVNLGVAGARNIGLKKAKGKYLCLLDIDTIVNKQAISEMMLFLEKESSCGVVACKLQNSKGEIQNSCRKLPALRYKIYNLLEVIFGKYSFTQALKHQIEICNNSQFYKNEILTNVPFPVEYVIGACQLIRKEALEEVGLLDENIFYGPEDADFCIRIRNKGWEIYYLPHVSIIHEYQRITNKKPFSKMSLRHIKALFYYFWKHKRF